MYSENEGIFYSGSTISGPCFEETLKLWYLFLTRLLVSTTVTKSAISQEYCDKPGHSVGFFTQKEGNSSHFIDGMCLVCKAELLPLENVQCAQELGHTPFLNQLQLLPPNHSLACQQLGLLSSAAKALHRRRVGLWHGKESNLWLT